MGEQCDVCGTTQPVDTEIYVSRCCDRTWCSACLDLHLAHDYDAITCRDCGMDVTRALIMAKSARQTQLRDARLLIASSVFARSYTLALLRCPLHEHTGQLANRYLEETEEILALVTSPIDAENREGMRRMHTPFVSPLNAASKREAQ